MFFSSEFQVAAAAGRVDTLKRGVRRAKRGAASPEPNNRSDIPHPLPQGYTTMRDDKSFLIYDNGPGDDRVLLFASDNPYMLSMHCVAHKLALSCIDATKSVREVGYYEGMLHAIHSYFSRSSKRLEHLRNWQDVLDDPHVRPLAVHQIRWLSFANCVTNVRRMLPSLLKTLQSDGEDDHLAESLFSGMSSYKFLFLTHFFSDIMSEIALLSRKFQERDLKYDDLKKTLDATCGSIEQQYLVEDPSYGHTLREFVQAYAEADTFQDFEIKRSHKDSKLTGAVSEFATNLLNSVRSRFPKLEIWDALSIFNPNTFPNTVKAKATFGGERLTVLLNHFGEKRGSYTPPICPVEAKKEWSLFKNHVCQCRGVTRRRKPFHCVFISRTDAFVGTDATGVSQYDKAYGNRYCFAS